MTETEILAESKCTPYGDDERPVTEEEMAQFQLQVPAWQLVEQDGVNRLERAFRFRNFVEALAFTNRVGELAEAEDHHPALLTEWGRVTVTWWTHRVKGLHRNDFVMAAKTDRAYAMD
jgi:4a-hydroxytetrahydrobiopterin dehydratase